VTDHLLARNVQRGDGTDIARSRAMIGRAGERRGFVNARSADEIAFGLNATSFIRAISLARQTLESRRDHRSDLDHEGMSHVLALERVGARIAVACACWDDGARCTRRLRAAADPDDELVACTWHRNATAASSMS